MTIDDVLEECQRAVQCGLATPMRYLHAPRYVRFQTEEILTRFCPLTLAYYRITGKIADTGYAMEAAEKINVPREVAKEIIWYADDNPGQLADRMLAMFPPQELR